MRNPATMFLIATASAAMLAGCTGAGLFKNLVPTPQPSPMITVNPASLSFSAANRGPSTITASESNGNTFFSASTTDATIATVSTDPVSTNVFHVTATNKAGSCNITVSDGAGATFNVAVTNN